MFKISLNENAFTLIEIILVVAIIGIISAVVIVSLKPAELMDNARYSRASQELTQIGKALEMWEATEGDLPDDVYRDLPPGIEKYLSSNDQWPTGPYSGSVYDYDNWEDETCIDEEASGTVQITLRQVPGFNPDGSDVWAIYYVIRGKGTPHCLDMNEWDKGHCINCSDQ